MGLLAAGSRLIRELRTWTLAPIGLVLVVVLLAAGVVAMLATGGEPSDESLVRKYFASAAGGGAPPEQTRLIEVKDCRRATQTEEEFIYECTVVFRNVAHTACFALDQRPIVLGSRQLGYGIGCEPLAWDRRSGRLISG